MLMQVNIPGERAELIGLDWDTFEINSRGAFPSDLVFNDVAMVFRAFAKFGKFSLIQI